MFSGFGDSAETAPPPYSDQSPSSETSLTSLLPTQSHKLQCALLVLLCTDIQRRQLLATFEPPARQSNATTLAAQRNEGHIRVNAEEPQPKEPSVSADLAARRQKELAGADAQALRKAALEYFDAWRAKVLRRTCDALGVRADNVRQARKQHQAHQAKREAGKPQESDNLVQWAATQNEPEAKSKPPSRYSAAPTELLKMQYEKRVLLLECFVLLLLSLESYSAHSRLLLLHFASSIGLDSTTLAQHESTVARGLLSAASQMSAEEARKARAAENSAGAKWKIGLAAVGGAVLLGVTGGLAAPLLAAGLGTVFGGLGLGAVSTLLGALASNTVLIAGLFGAYGGRMTGQMMERYEREVEDFRFLPIRHSLTEGLGTARPTVSRKPSGSNEERQKLRVAIGISGSLITEEDMILPWSILDKSRVETFALRWEVAALLRLGVSLTSVLKSYAWQYAKWELARRTLLSAVAAGLWPLGLLKLAGIIDNPFSVARARADKAGKVLADALINKCQGERPVTLIGFSVGARVIYSCLLELADRKAFGLIENVVLMGAPAPSNSEPWTKVRSVVSGRVVNCFSANDYILGFLYRASSGQFEVAGLQNIEGVNGVENFDFSVQVKGHTRYRHMIGQILQEIDFEDVDPDEVEREYAILKALDNEEAKLEAQSQGQAPSYDEATRIESSIRERVGSPAQSPGVNMDEAEERRRQELLRAAEEREATARGGPPPAYEDMPSKSGSTPASAEATRRPGMGNVAPSASGASVLTNVDHIRPQIDALHVSEDHRDPDGTESVASEAVSVESGPLEMLHVAPVPEDDNDDDDRDNADRST